jgi:hypothetical protein
LFSLLQGLIYPVFGRIGGMIRYKVGNVERWLCPSGAAPDRSQQTAHNQNPGGASRVELRFPEEEQFPGQTQEPVGFVSGPGLDNKPDSSTFAKDRLN